MNFSLAAMLVLGLVGCGDRAEASPSPRPRIVATIHPVAAILREVAGDRAQVTCILRPGVSEHLFEARPSDMRAAEDAIVLVSCAPDIDAWSERIPSRQRIRLVDFVPQDRLLPSYCEHDEAGHESHGSWVADGHFWTDPMVVREVLPSLARELGRLDPDGAAIYESNAARFGRALVELDAETSATLAGVRGRPVFTYHAGLRYMLDRHGLEFCGVVEMIPGQEPSAAQVASLIARMRHAGADALFTEPHLPPRAAQVLSSATGVEVYELDPIGGIPGRMTYRELIEYNARTLARALSPRGGGERAEAPR